MPVQVALDGDLVRLEPLADSHLEGLVLAASESRDSYQFAHVPDGTEAMTAFVTHALVEQRDGLRLPFVTCSRDSGRVLGTTSFLDIETWRWPPGSEHQREGRPDAVEIGSTWLCASAQRTGVNVEAKLLMLSRAFDTWQVHRVRLRTDERNSRSRQAIERLGAAFDGVLRGDKPGPDDTVRNSAYYSILAGEWPAVRTRLLERLGRR